MANNTGSRRSSGSGNTTNRRTTQTRKRNNKKKRFTNEELLLINYSVIIGSVFMCILLFLCNFGKVGVFGKVISSIMFGAFGWLAYVFPVLLLVLALLWIAKQSDKSIKIKIIAFIVLFFSIGIIIEMFSGVSKELDSFDIKSFIERGYEEHSGGGLICGVVGYGVNKLFDTPITVAINILIALISFLVIFGSSIVGFWIKNKDSISDAAKEVNEYRREKILKRKEQLENEEDYDEDSLNVRNNKRNLKNSKKEEEKKRLSALKENEETDGILRMDKKVRGVTFDTDLKNAAANAKSDDMHEIVISDVAEVKKETIRVKDSNPLDKNIRFHTAEYDDDKHSNEFDNSIDNVKATTEKTDKVQIDKPVAVKPHSQRTNVESDVNTNEVINDIKPLSNKKYKFPPLNLLSKNENSISTSRDALTETAHKLEDALDSFGVSAHVTDVSQGPSVTRYELEPAVGVKVSRIKSLADDLKLHLAAKDIRIEAPIPGKSAVGIEVPNAESSGVKLRELFEDSEFKNFSGNIAFAVGKDISGKVIVTDISKMPHMLIAGSTGSGKSVCINTIIMSILYKHDPKDVQLIMVDPKVVELNVYNGIPHLMIPVVTDPKKAAGALHWAVNEMTDRYKKFADLSVRDLKGYNKKADEMRDAGDANAPAHLPQIVIIVDELADLMMVAAKEVEEAICRLAQLARACGIHLILATQRPSVDVITGLIKANMPSRVAFAVSSGTDSRTILDMNGAEKLLGKGDMLFYPQGYTKPSRIQGAFVSDAEVAEVVDYIKDQKVLNVFGQNVADSIEKVTSSGGNSNSSGGDSGSEFDDLFVQAGQFIIDQDKASIGNLQRKFRIGFNRAARIMDQLCEAGVVGEEQGTKPREILMSPEQFEEFIEEYV